MTISDIVFRLMEYIELLGSKNGWPEFFHEMRDFTPFQKPFTLRDILKQAIWYCGSLNELASRSPGWWDAFIALTLRRPRETDFPVWPDGQNDSK